VTHLVTSCDIEKNKKILDGRTMKYFKSIASGCWVLCFNWIEDSINSRMLCNESKYEIAGDMKGDYSSKKSREMREQVSNVGLYTNLNVIIAKQFRFNNLSDDLNIIFEIGGAKIITKENIGNSSNNDNMVCVYDNFL